MKIIKALSASMAFVLYMVLAISCPVPGGIDDGHTLFEEIIITPQGGTFGFSQGFSLVVPAGAVDRNTEAGMRRVEKKELLSLFQNRGVSIDNMYACIEAEPDGLVFLLPVTLVIHADIEAGEVPFVHEINLSRQTWKPVQTTVECDPEYSTLSVSLNHFSAYAVEQVEEIKRANAYCEENPCRCGATIIEQYNIDMICEMGECQVGETRVAVHYIDCEGQPVEEFRIREISSGCVPKLTVASGSTTVSPGAHTIISGIITLGCEAVEGQPVDFSISGPASLAPTFYMTDENGKAETTFTAGESEGVATVTLNATVNYYMYTVYASAGGQEETINGPLKIQSLSSGIAVEIKEGDDWTGTLDYTVSMSGENVILIEAVYTIDVHFTVFGEGTDKEIAGNAIAEQVVASLSANAVILDAPSNLDLMVIGDVDSHVHMGLLIDMDLTPMFHWALCGEGGCIALPGFSGLSLGCFEDVEAVPLNEGTFHGEFSQEDADGGVFASYTITLTHDE